MTRVAHDSAGGRLEEAARQSSRGADPIPQIWAGFADPKSRSEFEEALVAIARKRVAGARLAAILVDTHPEYRWPSELALSIARHLRAEARAEGDVVFDALKGWAKRDEALASQLLMALIVQPRTEDVQVDLLWVCETARLRDPETFARALKRSAAISDSANGVSLSGVVFAGIADLPPTEDGRIRAFLRTIVDGLFRDLDWVQGARETALLDIIRDFLNLACVLACRRLFVDAFERSLEVARSRSWTQPIAARLAAPLVLLKGDAPVLAPWIEADYQAAIGADDGAYARKIGEELRSGYFRHLKRNPVIERKQEWRKRWAERSAAHGEQCERPDCRL